MKKKRAIRNYTLISIFIVLTLLLSVISFPVPWTNYRFVGFVNMHAGLDIDGGVKNTYDIEVADWFDGTQAKAYIKTRDKVQTLVDKYYADARVYLTNDDQITIEVPDTTINSLFVIGLLEMKSESGADAEAKITGKDIAKVEYMLSGTTHGVYIEFTNEGKKKFEQLTETVSISDSQTMYIYMNKDYENPFSEPTVNEKNTMGYTFISGSGITDKASGEQYALKLQSAMLGVNMTTKTNTIEVKGIYGHHVKTVIVIVTALAILLSILLAYLLFRELGLVSALSLLFAMSISIIIYAMFDLQLTFAGFAGFVTGYIFNFVLHIYFLNNIKAQYAKGKKFTVAFTANYVPTILNILDILLISAGTLLLGLIIPSTAVKMFVYNFLMTLPATALTSMLILKILANNYTAFNLKNEKRVNFAREENVNEIE